jgi:hypothetical protein
VFAVIFDEINHSDAIPEFPIMGFEGKLEHPLLAGLAVNEDVPFLQGGDGFETEDGAIRVQLLGLLEGEGVEVRVDCNFLSQNFVFVSFGVHLQDGVEFALS